MTMRSAPYRAGPQNGAVAAPRGHRRRPEAKLITGGATARKSSTTPSAPAPLCPPLPGAGGGLLLGQPAAYLLIEHREVLDLGQHPIGRVDRADRVDQHVDRAPGRRQLLELALDQHQRLGPDRQPMALIDRRRDDQVDRPVLVLEQDEHDPRSRPRSLARHDQPADPHPPPVLEPLQIRAGDDLRPEPLTQQRHRMRPRRQPDRVVVGEHPLPLRQLLQRRGRRQIERERQLRAARARAAPASSPPAATARSAAPTRGRSPSRRPAGRRASIRSFRPPLRAEGAAACGRTRPPHPRARKRQRVARPRPRQQRQRVRARAGP